MIKIKEQCDFGEDDSVFVMFLKDKFRKCDVGTNEIQSIGYRYTIENGKGSVIISPADKC